MDYYELLGVDRRTTVVDLRRAFRSKVLLAHPDRNPGDAEAGERTRLMVEAYRTLSNPVSRRQYDLALFSAACPPMAWSWPKSSSASMWPRIALLFVAAALTIALAIALALSVVSDRPPVFTFHITDRALDVQPRHAALLVEPGLTSLLEWYETIQYQHGAANAFVTRRTTEVYLNALRGAERRGDRESAEFYRRSLREISRSKEFLAPLDEEFGGEPAFEGPKSSAGSS